MGREAVRGRFLVDAGRSYYGGAPARKKKKAKGESGSLQTHGPATDHERG